MIKLIALDLDETLLMQDKTIPDEAVKALSLAAEKGAMPVIATGRIFPSAALYSKRLGINSPSVCYNGAMIRTADGGVLKSVTLDEDAAQAIAEFCMERNLFMQAYNNDDVVIARRVPIAGRDTDFFNTNVRELGDFRRVKLPPTPKIIILDEPERLDEIWHDIEKVCPEKVYISKSQDYVMEVMPLGISKKNTLAEFAKMQGIDRSEVIACGDNLNDIEMVEWAGIGVSVANGVPQIKAAADYVCEKERSFGVIEAVEKFILNA